jgi:outer membrane protein assembly factor BamB/flavin-binding protein dodecin
MTDSPKRLLKLILSGVLQRRAVFFSLLLCFLTSLPLLAEHTRRWRQTTYEEFLKGTAHGVAVRSDGRLELAPKFKLLADADASYLWSVRLDPKGTLYAAGGSPAKVFRFDANGKPAVAFDSTELSAQAIAFDSKGVLYVGTSPDGKVYRVSASGEKSVFFDPKTKYIWDLAFSSDGTLYVATGDKGQVFAVAPDGKGELFYSSDEAHIRVLAFDAKGNLIAGTEPSARILRISRSSSKSSAKDSKDSAAAKAEGFVLYETSKREVTSLAVAADGTIYVSAIGEKPRAGQAPSAIIAMPQGTTTVTTGGVASSSQVQTQPFVPFPTVFSSSIYRISAEGAPEELWSSREDVVYTLGLASDGRLLAGTGNSGALLAVDGHGIFARLAKSGSAQITGIARNSSGKVFLCTANPGKVYSIGPEYEAEGTFESRSFDAQLFSKWGRLEWWSPPPAAAAKSSDHSNEPRVEFFVRSGNTEDPGREWSRWFGPYIGSGSETEAPSARFVQWKAVIHDGRPGDGIDWVSLAYLPRNVAPVIDGIALQDPGVRAQSQAGLSSGQPTTATLKTPPSPNISGVVITQSTTSPRFEQTPQGTLQKGYQSVLWTAHDDNDDDMRYAVYFRGENEHEWKLLKDNLEQKFYSWDTTAFPDGAYYLKIVATDAPSNPPALALKTERESERFEVDNTPPLVEDLRVGPASEKMSGGQPASFIARDASSAIDRAQYSLDGGDWVPVAPSTGISDAPVEHYEFGLPALAPGEHTISVRAYDRFENVGSAKTTFTIPTAKTSSPARGKNLSSRAKRPKAPAAPEKISTDTPSRA